jgi:hypothetical protein
MQCDIFLRGRQWEAILADAAGKGWPAPPETTAALGALLAAGYKDCFYLSDNHRCARARTDTRPPRRSRHAARPGPRYRATRHSGRIHRPSRQKTKSRGALSALVSHLCSSARGSRDLAAPVPSA